MYSFFVGIDIGKWNHQAAFMDSSGVKTAPDAAFSNTSEGFQLLSKSLSSFDKEQTVIGMEATGHYWLALYSFLLDNAWTVKVINPMQSDALRNINIRKTKTDRKDSVLIADVLRFGRYTETVLPEEELLQLREISRFRCGLVENTGSQKRRILGILDRIFPEFASCFSTVFGTTPTELLQEFSDPEELANCDIGKLIKLLEKESRGRHSESKAQELKKKAAQSIGIRLGLEALKFEVTVQQVFKIFRKKYEKKNMSAYKRNYGNDILVELERERGERLRLEGKVAELECKLVSVTAELTAKIDSLLGEAAKRDNEISRLKSQIDKDSSNSSKPPSSNGFKKITNNREKSGKKQGGQKGHKGSTLTIPGNLDELVASGKAEHKIIIEVSEGEPWVSDWEIDLKVVTVYRETRRAVGKPPKIEYGKELKGLSVYLPTIGLIAVNRLSVLFSDISGGLISAAKATLQTFNHEAAENADINPLTNELLNGAIMHVDETPVKTTERETLDGGVETSENTTLSAYVRTYSNSRTTVLTPNAHKNTESVEHDDILPRFCGVAVQDFEAKFLKFGTETALCGAHLSRELKGLAELEKVEWANDVRQFFQKMNEHKNADIQDAAPYCDPDKLRMFEKMYDELVEKGRGYLASLKPKTYAFKTLAPMVNRLSARKTEYMLFMRDYSVPYTNNLAGRDLRHCKTKLKISGCYRSWQGLVDYCKLRSILDTARKCGNNLLDALFALFGNTLPAGL